MKHNGLDITATAFVINNNCTKTVMIYHKKFNKWNIPGGHVDDNEAIHLAALREVQEETGLKTNVVELFKSPILIDTEQEKNAPMPYLVLEELIAAYKDEYRDQPAHKHYDFIYVVKSDSEKILYDKKESSDIGWFTKEEVLNMNTFTSVKEIAKKVLK